MFAWKIGSSPQYTALTTQNIISFVAAGEYYISQGCSGGIRTCLHMGEGTNRILFVNEEMKRNVFSARYGSD
jgi:hypothetical protein